MHGWYRLHQALLPPIKLTRGVGGHTNVSIRSDLFSSFFTNLRGKQERGMSECGFVSPNGRCGHPGTGKGGCCSRHGCPSCGNGKKSSAAFCDACGASQRGKSISMSGEKKSGVNISSACHVVPPTVLEEGGGVHTSSQLKCSADTNGG